LIAILVWLVLNLAEVFVLSWTEERMLRVKFLFLLYCATELFLSAGDTCTPTLQHSASFLSGSCWRPSTRKQ